jgi:hypothetical protein
MKAIEALSAKRIEPWFRAIIILSTCLILVGAYFAGLARGLDSYIGSYQIGPFLLGVCATATKWLTRVGDYVCLGDIFPWQSGIMYDLGLRVQYDHLYNREFIDHALQQLFAHPHWTVPPTTTGPPYNGLGPIGWGMDEGYAKFVQLAFFLFGPKLEALYRTYWLVFGISAAAYLFAYRRALAPLLVLLAFAVVQYWIFSTSIMWFTDGTNPITDPGSPRFLSILCIVPVLHLVAAARSNNPWRRPDLALIALQGLVLGLALLQRISVEWVILALFVLAAVYWVWRRRVRPTAPKRRYWSVAAFALTVLVATHLYSNFVRNPGLAAIGAVSYHNVWFTLVEKLYYDPDWEARYGAEYDHKTFDEMASLFCHRYLARHKEEWPRWNPSNGDPYQVGLSGVGMEDLCRKAFFEFFRNDPKYVLNNFLVVGTKRAIDMGATIVAEYVHWLWGIPFTFLIAIGAISGLIGTRRVLLSTLGYVPLALYLAAVAVSPNWLTYLTDLTMTDYFVMLAITAGVAIVAVGAALGAFSVEAVRRMAPYKSGDVGPSLSLSP